MSDTTYSGPFERAAHMYRAAGWHGTLPLGDRPGKKYPPPRGWTGHGAPFPSAADVESWRETDGDRNIGLRLPAGVLGLDVDAYPGKRGGETLAALIAKHGELPPTWITTARTDGVSGIRLFRVPTHLDGREINWPGEAGTHIEIIQTGHRYAVVWPSTNPEADGARYEWHYQGRSVEAALTEVPQPTALADLPETWVRGLALAYDRTEKADLGSGAQGEYLRSLRSGEPCAVVVATRDRAVNELRAVDGSRHETARDALAALVRLGGEGHRGAQDAAAAVGAAFVAAVGKERAVDNGELQRLVGGAVKLAAADNRTPRQSCEHDAATAVTLSPELAASFVLPEPVSEPTPPAPGSGELTLPEEFWAARESLRKVRQAAHSRVRSGDVVLHGLLVRLSAMAPHTLRAETGIGTAASLNLFSAIVGPSGGGKSSGLSVSRELVKADRPPEEFPLGSGEGIAESYMGEALEGTGVMDQKTGDEKQAKVRKQVRHNVLFHSDEGASLTKLIERSGSTVGETLRSAWSGESIGQKNGRAETTRTVPARAYAAGLLIGFQPTTALPMLADVDAGTPQRFLWCWAVDPTIPARAARVQWPGEMLSPFPSDVPTDLPAPGAIVSAPRLTDEPMTFVETILDELYEIEHAKASGSLPAEHPLRDPFRSQHPVLKVKVASLLALLEGRRRVDESDWALAQIVIDTSDRVREHLQDLARAAAGKARAASLAAEAETEAHRAHARATVSAALDQTAERRVAMRIATWVHEGEPVTIGGLRRRATSGDRKHVEAAVQLGIEAGWLTAGEDAKIHAGPSRPV